MPRRRPRALDLFCGAGGASKGLQDAGFQVYGIDLDPACGRHYVHPGRFVAADALWPPVRLEDFAFIWASPPCQRFSIATASGGPDAYKAYPNLIGATRKLIAESGVPGVIENVPQAPVRPDVVLNGAMFGLPIVRRRHFECIGFTPPLALSQRWAGKSVQQGTLACVAGQGGGKADYRVKWRDMPADRKRRIMARNSRRGWAEAMGIDWMPKAHLAQAVPPAYARFVGEAFLAGWEPRR